jgi:hypothetical protein
MVAFSARDEIVDANLRRFPVWPVCCPDPVRTTRDAFWSLRWADEASIVLGLAKLE